MLPDSDSEDENDNTQEIQIEEALKLYQQALRHHTDRQWDKAQKAYGELFQSEIFQIDVEEQVPTHYRGREGSGRSVVLKQLTQAWFPGQRPHQQRCVVATPRPIPLFQEPGRLQTRAPESHNLDPERRRSSVGSHAGAAVVCYGVGSGHGRLCAVAAIGTAGCRSFVGPLGSVCARIRA